MATFQKRGESWRALVRIKGFRSASKTFHSKGMAKTWAERTEREFAQRIASGKTDAEFLTLRACIEWYTHPDREHESWGRTKSADLNRLLGYEIVDRVAAGLKATDYIRHIEGRRRMGAGPATAGNDLIWLRQVLRAARTGLTVPVDLQELDDAAEDLRRRRVIQKSRQRDRRLSKGEEETLLAHFASRDGRAEIPMAAIVRFALATSRREDEITRLLWRDLDKEKGIAWLDDVKHPRQKNRKSTSVSDAS